ncbi:Di-sulfide bridge nucleocytoplasmic transport domain [Geosmithia morbida]|uniref:Di-sulfide bridge nucleocytoplasmic transport domain n=1 Tax=Geosmithia morbida TaxID=1094350 RepID=A0A9P4YM10_9HYPO|nr:Di-sulfide bridge nucleocytoplasmic transport domain [Geosmithia morbida]KAF4119451.1 Di-sulfide bridge nucleocytoplasmic transport domain [Geosmithia morbida]
MDRRTYEGPMDWEYQNKGPIDPTSPFAQAAQNRGLRNGFASPSKPTPSIFASPTKNPQHRTLFSSQQTSSLSKPSAPPFRNPAFTTPRKPFDQVVMSETSDMEDSPARTEASDFANDTPEADRMGDVSMSGTVTPAKIDKIFRYSKAASSNRRHMPGKGEIRPHRDYGLSELTRRKKRYGHERDLYHGRQQSQDSDMELDDDMDYNGRRRRNDRAPKRQGGLVGSMFHMMEEHNTAPENLYRWIQLGINGFMGGLFCVVVISVVHTIRSDIRAVNEAARQEIRVKMAACQDEYMANHCATTNAPAFKKMCSEWYDCMMQDPESIVRVRATMTEVANIMNDFFGNLNLKAWGAVLAFLVITTFANNLMIGAKSAPAPGPVARPTISSSGSHLEHPSSRGDVMWIPVQTPKMRSRRFIDDDTDTDSTPPNMHKMLPPYTPSGKRSPSKRERSLSPIKYGRSPMKGY